MHVARNWAQVNLIIGDVRMKIASSIIEETEICKRAIHKIVIDAGEMAIGEAIYTSAKIAEGLGHSYFLFGF